MADPDYIFVDGFDVYGYTLGRTVEHAFAASVASLGKWTANAGASGDRIQGAPPISTSLGRSLTMGNNVSLYKTLPSAFARVVGGFHTLYPTTDGNFRLVFSRTGGTLQNAAIQLTGSTGLITVYNAANVVVGTGSTVFSTGVSHCIEFDITQHASAGIINIWVDGVAELTVTGLNTGSSGHDRLTMITPNSGVPSYRIDHLYTWWYTAAGGSETPALTNPLIQTDWGESTDATDFTPVVIAIGELDMSTNIAATANRTFVRKITPVGNMTLDGMRSTPRTTSAIAKFKSVLYADSGGVPGALIDSGAEVVGCTSGSVLTLPFSAGQALTGGTSYWIGYITDTNLQTSMKDSASTNPDSGFFTRLYSSGPENPAPAITIGFDLSFWGYGTTISDNVDIVSEVFPYSANYVESNVVGDKDLFNFPPLDYTPTDVYSVSLNAYAMRSDASAKTMDLIADSGGTEGSGSNAGITPGTSLQHVTTHFLTDPNTSAAWLPAAVAASKYGYKVAS